MFLIEPRAEDKFQMRSSAFPGKDISFLVGKFGLDTCGAVSRTGQNPIPATVIDRVVAEITTQSHTITDIGEALLDFTLRLGRKCFFAAKDSASQDEFQAFSWLGWDELQTLFYLVDTGARVLQLDCDTRQLTSICIFSSNCSFENHGAVISQA